MDQCSQWISERWEDAGRWAASTCVGYSGLCVRESQMIFQLFYFFLHIILFLIYLRRLITIWIKGMAVAFCAAEWANANWRCLNLIALYEYKIRSFIARCKLLLLFIQFEMLSARNCWFRKIDLEFFLLIACPIRLGTFGLCVRYAEPLHTAFYVTICGRVNRQ